MAESLSFDIFARDHASAVFGRVGMHADGLGKKMGLLSKAALATGIGTAVVGVVALGKAMVDGVTDAAHYQDLQNRTANVLKTTGNAAHTSVKLIEAHAAALESLSGVDEELIINSQNVLLTFTGIRNEAGKGNKIFDQATTAALNMSTALGTDLQGASIQVGKALNDPVKGITALRKVGVSFTAAQIAQVKAMVKSGDTMGAQKLILGELSKEFGGAAKAAGQGFNGSMARVKDVVADTFRDIGMKLLPSITKLANWMAANLPKAIERTIAVITRLHGWWTSKMLPALKSAWQTILPGVQKAFSILSSGIGSNHMSWQKLGAIITGKVIPAVALIIRAYLPVLATNLRTIIGVVQVGWKAFQTYGSIAMTIIRAVAAAFFTAAGILVNGAAKAFGWIPGIGPKLKSAAAAFNTFRDKTNAALNGIHNKTVIIDLQARGLTQLTKGNFKGKVIPMAEGGIVKAKPGGTLALLAEAGHDEAVVPLSGPHAVARPSGAGIAAAGGGDTYHIHLHGVIADKATAGAMMEEALLAAQRKKGGAPLAFRAAT